MRHFLAALAAASIAIAAAPRAHAADVAQIDCPLTAMSEAQRLALGEHASHLGSRQDPVVVPFESAVTRCADELHWDSGRRDAARLHGLASLMQAAVRRQFAQDGIDLAELERVLLADTELTASYRSAGSLEAAVQAFTRRNVAMVLRLLGPHGADSAYVERAGYFIAARAIVEASRIRFAGD
jgi:hypothetical protein